MKLGYIVGMTSLALSCAAKTPEPIPKQESQRAIENYINTFNAYFCQKFTWLYNKTSASIEERCPMVIPAELDEVCHDFEMMKDELKQRMDEFCH